jgi:hypothetical protein
MSYLDEYQDSREFFMNEHGEFASYESPQLGLLPLVNARIGPHRDERYDRVIEAAALRRFLRDA